MHAKIEIMGQRMELATSHPFAGLDAEIPGAYYSARKRRWSLPLGMAVCRNVREVFGSDLEIGPKLTAWARMEIEREQSQRALGRTLAAVPLPGVEARSPRLAQALLSRPYQTSGARFVADGRWTLIADTPGLGKTTEAIAGVVESGISGPFLVAAPVAAMNDAWEREILTRLGDSARVAVITGSKAQREAKLHRAFHGGSRENLWVITNIEMLRTKIWWVCPECEQKWVASDKPKSTVVDCGHNPNKVKVEKDHQFPILFDVQWGALIMDECQRILLRNTGSSTQTRKGAMLLEMLPEGLRVALSGTPMRGKPQRLWGVLNWLRPDIFKGYWSWVERAWDVSQTGYGGARVIGRFREERRAAFEADLDRYMLRRTKQEVSPGLPPKAYMGTPLEPLNPNSPVAVWLPMEDKQARAYREMLMLSATQLDEGHLNAVGILAQITRMKQFSSTYGRMETVRRRITGEREASQRAYRRARGAPDLPDELWEDIEVFRPEFPSNKWDWLEQWLRERNLLGEDDADEMPDTKVVIVSHFTSILKLISDRLVELKSKHAMVTGEVTGVGRQSRIDKFNDPISGINIMLLNTIAGGVALTLDAADDMVFLDETHVPDDQEQAEGRIDNRRPEDKIVQRRYWYLKSIGSIDEAIARKNMEKDADQKQHLDGRRGVEYAREVFATMRELAERGNK